MNKFKMEGSELNNKSDSIDSYIEKIDDVPSLYSLTDSTNKLEYAKSMLIEYMKNNHFVIAPDEGVYSVTRMSVNTSNSEAAQNLNSKWFEDSNKFYMKFWMENILPVMDENALRNLIDNLGGKDIDGECASAILDVLN